MRRVPASRYVIFVALVAAGLSFDLWSKSVVFGDLGFPARQGIPFASGHHKVFSAAPQFEGESRPYLDGWITFRLFTSLNRGALWGFGQSFTKVFAGLSICAAIAVLCWLFVFGAAQSLWLTVSLSLILAGTGGNLFDRLGWHGYVDLEGKPIFAVRDFLLFTFGGWPWPVFNFADVFLVSGASLLVLHSLLPMSAEAATSTTDDTRANAPAPATKKSTN